MSPVETFAVVVAIVGAAWTLRSKLSDIEVALKGHVEHDAELHKDLETRIVKLEDFRGRR